VWWCLSDLSFVGCLYPSFYTQGGQGYNEDNRVGYDMISIMTLSLLVYFIYISMDIIIYTFRSTSWSSEIFWMVGRVVTNPSFDLPSPCEVVPWVLILVTAATGIPLVVWSANPG
jgi:hypothetical protein